MVSFLPIAWSHLSVSPALRSRDPEVFLTLCTLSVHLFKVLFLCRFASDSSACLLLALQGQQNRTLTPLSGPEHWLFHTSLHSSHHCLHCAVWLFDFNFYRYRFTHSGLGQDGLGLGFLGGNHGTLLTIPTKPELQKGHMTGMRKALHSYSLQYWSVVGRWWLVCAVAAAVSTYRQHQHSTGGSGNTISTRQTRTTRRTLLKKITKVMLYRIQCKENEHTERGGESYTSISGL